MIVNPILVVLASAILVFSFSFIVLTILFRSLLGESGKSVLAKDLIIITSLAITVIYLVSPYSVAAVISSTPWLALVLVIIMFSLMIASAVGIKAEPSSVYVKVGVAFGIIAIILSAIMGGVLGRSKMKSMQGTLSSTQSISSSPSAGPGTLVIGGEKSQVVNQQESETPESESMYRISWIFEPAYFYMLIFLGAITIIAYYLAKKGK